MSTPGFQDETAAQVLLTALGLLTIEEACIASANQKLYSLLEKVGFAYVIRLRKIIKVTSEQGECRKEEEWVPKAGQLRRLKGARVTAKQKQVGAVVCVKNNGMDEGSVVPGNE